jgi:hypoxanthine phosphoribosyltransferase
MDDMSGNPLPLSLTEPMRFSQPLDFDDARTALRAVAEHRRQAREWKQRSMAEEAEKERTYRKLRAEAWLKAPESTAKEREDWVNSETRDARYERDIASRLVKAADERLSEVDAERASLHRLIDWSMKVAPVPEAVA